MRVVIAALLVALPYYVASMMIEGSEMTMDDAIIKAGKNNTKMFEIMQDEDTVMVELDILYKMDTYMEMRKEMEMPEDSEGGRRKKRKAVRSTRYRWTNARVPYEISYEMSARDRQTIMNAISDYHSYTCLRFQPARSSERNRVRFQNGGGCSSYVGMIGGTQPISLAPGCRYKGIVIHEMGHAIGFHHEQTRPDRDGYVYIQTQNIQSGLQYNFMRYSNNQQNTFSVPYDYSSVMHYSQYAFSANGQPTIRARDVQYQSAMGNREGLSFNDIKLANLMYNCAGIRNCAAKQCPSNGFQGQDCECYCPSGSRSSPLKLCSGTSVVATTAPTAVTVPASCSDASQYCPRWSGLGYCTGTYETYMMKNCRFSCNYCSMTTTTTTTMATPPIENCEDQNRYCSYWATIGECQRNPGYMTTYCKRSCNKCGGQMECVDSNANCPAWTAYCNNEVYRDYLSMNCMRSCGVCTANDETQSTSTTPATASNNAECMDQRPAQYCNKRAARCAYHPTVKMLCKKTCGDC